VIERLRDIELEMGERRRLESEREALIDAAADLLAVPVDDVDLEVLVALGPPDEADAARRFSAELKGIVGEIERRHIENRVLVRQELAFLDHLMRAIAGTPQGGYTMTQPAAPVFASTLDSRA
jgi:hypothetical protein